MKRGVVQGAATSSSSLFDAKLVGAAQRDKNFRVILCHDDMFIIGDLEDIPDIRDRVIAVMEESLKLTLQPEKSELLVFRQLPDNPPVPLVRPTGRSRGRWRLLIS